ncbi:hypothetical protein QBC47DRAFT_408011 [Echria macrotheca]|uniref:Uncharacterized protein n=1 Tax=Echria macrotheca TaxID=438768 RepID=A0AAJ0B1G4_9PEZI|nr:hypothetical protein QBC47DRAFT_408011 [Echria macrotheca]
MSSLASSSSSGAGRGPGHRPADPSTADESSRRQRRREFQEQRDTAKAAAAAGDRQRSTANSPYTDRPVSSTPSAPSESIHRILNLEAHHTRRVPQRLIPTPPSQSHTPTKPVENKPKQDELGSWGINLSALWWFMSLGKTVWWWFLHPVFSFVAKLAVQFFLVLTMLVAVASVLLWAAQGTGHLAHWSFCSVVPQQVTTWSWLGCTSPEADWYTPSGSGTDASANVHNHSVLDLDLIDVDLDTALRMAADAAEVILEDMKARRVEPLQEQVQQAFSQSKAKIEKLRSTAHNLTSNIERDRVALAELLNEMAAQPVRPNSLLNRLTVSLFGHISSASSTMQTRISRACGTLRFAKSWREVMLEGDLREAAMNDALVLNFLKRPVHEAGWDNKRDADAGRARRDRERARAEMTKGRGDNKGRRDIQLRESILAAEEEVTGARSLAIAKTAVIQAGLSNIKNRFSGLRKHVDADIAGIRYLLGELPQLETKAAAWPAAVSASEVQSVEEGLVKKLTSYLRTIRKRYDAYKSS